MTFTLDEVIFDPLWNSRAMNEDFLNNFPSTGVPGVSALDEIK